MAVALIAGWTFLLYPRREFQKTTVKEKSAQKLKRTGGDQAWYRNVYLISPHWRQTRKKKIKIVGAKCQRCKRKDRPLDVHHKTYKRIGHERMSDLEVLCRECHDLKH